MRMVYYGSGPSITKPEQGFTIVEVIIVLAAMSLMAVAALTLLSGRINKTNLAIASNNFVLDMRQEVTDTLSSYLNGYDSFSCIGNGDASHVTFTTGSSLTDSGCIFLGSAVQFAPASDPSEFINYPIAGNQMSGTQLVNSLQEANPVPIAPYNNNLGVEVNANINYSQTHSIGYGITVVSVTADNNPTGELAFLEGDSTNSLSTYDPNQNLNSGGLQLYLYYVNGTKLGDTSLTDTTAIASSNSTNDLKLATTADICLDEGDQKSVLVTIDDRYNLNVSSTNMNGDTCS